MPDIEAPERVANRRLSADLGDEDRRSARHERSKSEFLRLASHELRSPLAIISGYLSMVLGSDFGELNPEVHKALEIAFERCQDMSGLIDRMLDAARIEDGSIRLAQETVDVRDTARAAVATVAADGKRTRVALHTGDHEVMVRADRAQLQKAIAALIDNALKFSPPDGDVVCEVAADEQHNQAMVVVNDRGRGIASLELSRLFEPFGRVVTPETSHIFGSGLGLFLARQLARLHGGDVRLVETTPGAGSTFVLTLPTACDRSEPPPAAGDD